MVKCSETPGVSLANFCVYFPPTSAPVSFCTSSECRATASIAERVFSSGPTRRPTWAPVTVRLPLLVTVPDTVTVSPSPGAVGLSESSETDTASEEAACAGAAAGSCSSPASRGAPASSAPVCRIQCRAGEALVPWKSAASATRSPVPRRRQWSSECASTHGNDARGGEVPRTAPQDRETATTRPLYPVSSGERVYAAREGSCVGMAGGVHAAQSRRPRSPRPRTLFCCAEPQR